MAQGGKLDVLIAGDDADAKKSVSTFIESLGLRPLDAGDLAAARWLEAVGPLLMGWPTMAPDSPSASASPSRTEYSLSLGHIVRVLVTGGTGHIGSYLIARRAAISRISTG